MPEVIPHPAHALDMRIADLSSQLEILRSLAENAEDAEWLRLKPDVIAMFAIMREGVRSTDAPLARLFRRAS